MIVGFRKINNKNKNDLVKIHQMSFFFEKKILLYL